MQFTQSAMHASFLECTLRGFKLGQAKKAAACPQNRIPITLVMKLSARTFSETQTMVCSW